MRIVNQLSLAQDGFAFNPATGETFTVNDAGLLILKALQSGSTSDETVGLLAEAYQVPKDEASRDVLDFQNRLQCLGIS